MPPSAVVFDVGHVLIEWDRRLLYSRLIDDPGTLDAFLDDVVSLDWHAQHDAGVPFAQTSAALIERHPQQAGLIAQFGPRFDEMIPGPVAGMPALVADLDAAGVPMFAITNYSAEFWPACAARFDAMIGRFRDVVVSGRERIVKPDPAIFALARDRFGLAAGEALFVDDRADNVAAAARAGFVPHHFRSATTLRSDLDQHGLLSATKS